MPHQAKETLITNQAKELHILLQAKDILNTPGAKEI